MKKKGLLVLMLMLFTLTNFAQNYKVGDKVEFECNNCFGRNGWVAGTIEKMSGDTYQIRYGTEPQQFRTGIPNRLLREADFANKENKRQQFFRETSDYRMSVYYLMQVHDKNLLVNGSQAYRPPVRAEDWTKLKNDLAAMDNLCKTKYAGMTNGRPTDDTDLDQLPATWCVIAARHKEYEQKARGLAASDQFTPILLGMKNAIQQNIDNPNEYIDEDIQLLMYEREKWKTSQNAKLQPNFAKLGVTMPADFFKEIEAKADQLKIINEQNAPNRSFLMPKYKDAAIEAFIRGRYAAEKKGVQILKIGLDDANWIIHRNSLGVPTSQTKVARLLVKIANRPFCQEHSVAAERNYKGGSYGALSVDGGKVGEEGLFMKCE
mgnify:CR=1 FL=1